MSMSSVSIFGSGYVGCVSAACLARDGAKVLAVDIDRAKVESIQAGRAPIYEPGLDALIGHAVSEGTLEATTDALGAVARTDVSMVCVGTPSKPDGSLETQFVENVAREIGNALRKKDGHIVVIRSTILPGTMEGVIIPALEAASGKRAGEGFSVGYYPEFLRESTAIADYDAPGAIVFGQLGEDERAVEALSSLVAHIPVTPHVVDIRTAEIIKYVNNCWHANKISFANEIGLLCKSAGIDGNEVMRVVCADTRLNVSPAYMMPGFAYGGSCLPKDLRALRAFGRMNNVATPMLDASVQANANQLDHAFEMVRQTGKTKLGLIGLTFKENTDDLRESPLVALAERLNGKGYELSIFDPNVSSAKEGDRAYVPHLARYIRGSAAEAVEASDVIIVGNRDVARRDAIPAIKGDAKTVIDLVGIEAPGAAHIRYDGICW